MQGKTYGERYQVMSDILQSYFNVEEEEIPVLRDCDMMTIVHCMLAGMSMQEACNFNFLKYEEDINNYDNWTPEAKAAYYYYTK